MTERRDRDSVTEMRDRKDSQETVKKIAQMARDHRDLQVWREAIALVTDVYRFTRELPKNEMFGMVAQMRRAAVSVPSNVAEGAARGTSREFRQYLFIARGSLAELETQVIIARNLNDVSETSRLEQRIRQVLMLLSALSRSLEQKARR